MSAYIDPDEVSIQVGSSRFKPWLSVSITRSCESLPNSWQVTASTEFMQNAAAMKAMRPGQACSIYIGDDLVITGWIDRRSITAAPRLHNVIMSGRGITRNLVDCSADLIKDPGLQGGMINASNTLDLAQRLCKAFDITARSAVSDLGLAIRPFQVALGETPYEIIESVARYAGYLVYEDEKGNLVLDRVGTKSMASGFTMPGNIEVINADRSVDGRYSDYTVVYYAINQYSEQAPLANQRATVHDATMTEYRPLIRASGQITPDYDFGRAMANWEFARRLGRCQAATLTCDSWRDTGGKLWTPNWLAPLEAPAADITGAKWIIGSVTLRKDRSGTHADIVMMPPSAFQPQPNPLNLFDQEIADRPPASQTASPPSTSQPLGTQQPGQ